MGPRGQDIFLILKTAVEIASLSLRAQQGEAISIGPSEIASPRWCRARNDKSRVISEESEETYRQLPFLG